MGEKTGVPAKHCAYEAASAYELCPDPLPVACDYTLCNLAHKADVVVEQASMARSVRLCGPVGIKVQGLNDRRCWRRVRGHGYKIQRNRGSPMAVKEGARWTCSVLLSLSGVQARLSGWYPMNTQDVALRRRL